MWKQLLILSLTVPKVKWFALYHTNLSISQSSAKFCVIEVFKFWVILRWMKELRRHKSSSLGIPKAPQDNISISLKHLSLGRPRLASHLSSSTNYRLVSVDPKFLLLHMICDILANVILFCFAFCLNKIPRSEIIKRERVFT